MMVEGDPQHDNLIQQAIEQHWRVRNPGWLRIPVEADESRRQLSEAWNNLIGPDGKGNWDHFWYLTEMGFGPSTYTSSLERLVIEKLTDAGILGSGLVWEGEYSYFREIKGTWFIRNEHGYKVNLSPSGQLPPEAYCLTSKEEAIACARALQDFEQRSSGTVPPYEVVQMGEIIRIPGWHAVGGTGRPNL